MIVRNGILTTLRARKRTFLFTLLIFLLTAALTLGLGLWAYSSKMLDNCDDVYTSVAVVEYIGQDYNNEDAADEYVRTAMTAVDDAAICAIQGVKHWEKQRGTLAVVDGYRRSLGDIPFENYAVFTASRFIPFTDWMWADVEADEMPSQYVAYDTVENTYTFYNEGNAAGTYPGYYYDAASRQYYQALMVNGVLQSVSVSNGSLPDAYFIVNQDFKTAKAVGITDQTETLDICCYNPDTGTMSMQKETIVQYMVSMDNVLYSHENKDGVLVLVDVRGTDFVPEEGEKYVLHGTLSSEQGNRVFQFADFYEGCETLPWQRISGDDDPALESGIFKEYADKYRIANNYVRVEASDAIECLEVFHQGILYLDQGRFPKAGEENVCVISGTMAVQLGAAPGDTIELQELVSKAGDRYHIEEVQEKQTLTIVGITNANNDYDGRVWVSGAEEGVSSPLFGYQLGRAVLQNADALEAAEQMQSLMPDQTRVTLYDQGYSKAAEPLKNLRSTAMVVTVACICAAVVVLFLFAYLLVGRQRETIELLSALDTPGFKIWQWILSDCILIAGVLSALGAFAGNLIVGRMVDRVMEFTQNLYSVDDRYSESITGVTKALPPSIDIGGWPGPLAGAAVFLTALLLCGVFLRLTGKSGRHRRGETKLRLPKAGTSTAGQGAARFALISARRGGWRSKVVVMASLMLAIFLGLLLTGWRDRGRQLDELYENSQIEGMIVNTNRRSYNNLSIKAGYMADLWSTGLLDELGVSLGWNYWPKGTKPNFMNADREKVWIASQPEIIALNQITAAPEFYYIEEPEIEWLEGWDEGFLEKADQLPVWKGVSVRGDDRTGTGSLSGSGEQELS